MNISKRLERLEEKIMTQPGESHMVFVKPGQTAEEHIEKFKAESDVGPDDEFMIIEFVEPDPRRFEHNVANQG
jgi:hypothetical protein